MKFLKKLQIDRTYRQAISDASVIGLHMLSGTLVGGAMGYYLDRWLDTKPWMLFIFLGFGIAAGIKNTYTDTRRLLRGMDNAQRRSESNETKKDNNISR